MPLDRYTTRRRLLAAEKLRDMSPGEVGRRAHQQEGVAREIATIVAAAGLPRDLHPEEHQYVPLKANHVRALAGALELPEAWFTEPDESKLIVSGPSESPTPLPTARMLTQLDEAHQERREMRAALIALQRDVAEMRRRLLPSDPD